MHAETCFSGFFLKPDETICYKKIETKHEEEKQKQNHLFSYSFCFFLENFHKP